MALYAPERHEAIAALVRQRGRLSVTEVAASFGVTTETVRRDLAHLERAGLLRRVHGGAVPTSALATIERGIAERSISNAEEKERIARAALDFIPSTGSTIVIDAGTTTGRFAAELPKDRRLVVVTNAVPIAAIASGNVGVRLHLLGGRVRTKTHAAVGECAVEQLRAITVDTAFMGANGLSAERGLSTPDPAEGAVKQAMVQCARQVVALVDSSKLGQEHFVRFAEPGQISVVITDEGIQPATRRGLEAADIEVVVA